MSSRKGRKDGAIRGSFLPVRWSMRTIFFSGLRVYSTPSLWSSSTQIPVTSSGVKSSERIRTAQELAWSLRRREFATGSTASFPNPLISSNVLRVGRLHPLRRGASLRVVGLGEDDLEDQIEIAFARSLERGSSPPPKAHLLPRLGAGGNLHCHFSGKCGDPDFAAEHRFGNRHRNFHVEVVSLATNERMRLNLHLDQEVAGGPALESRCPLACQADSRSSLHAGRDLHRQPLRLPHSASPPAIWPPLTRPPASAPTP